MKTIRKTVTFFILHYLYNVSTAENMVCGGTWNGVEGNLQSPNFPLHYPNNIDCRWTISVPKSYQAVQLRFRKFNVENPKWAIICFRDYVDIFQYIDGRKRMTGRYCGKRGSFNITANSNKVEIRLRTNKYRARKGFSMHWIASTGCGEVQKGVHGEIGSKKFRGIGSPFCKWVIKAPESYGSITLKILKMRLEKYYYDCRRQYISIKDSRGIEIAKYCGKAHPRTLVIEGNEVTIRTKCKDASSFRLEAEWQANKENMETLNGTNGNVLPLTVHSGRKSAAIVHKVQGGGVVDENLCGMVDVKMKHNRQRRLVGASKATEGSWPWMARIRTLLVMGGFKFRQVICGGALISKNFIITAAHCVSFNRHIYKQEVMVGANSVYDHSAVYIKIKRIIVHPQYTHGIRHDLALLELERSVDYSYKTKPVCMKSLQTADASLNRWRKRSCWLGGWGQVGLNQPSSEFLQYLQVKLWLNCLRSPLNFCGVYDSKKRGTCQGDSGSPLICLNEEDDRYYLIGLLSHGPTPCLSQFDTYVNTGLYSTWIKTVLGNTTQSVIHQNNVNS